MRITEQFVGKFFKAADVSVPRTLIVDDVTMEQMSDGDDRIVVRFAGERQRLVLNQTNADTCVALLGDESTAWHGQKLELYVTTTDYNGKPTLGIRVRSPRTTATHSPKSQLLNVPKPTVPVPKVSVPKVPVPDVLVPKSNRPTAIPPNGSAQRNARKKPLFKKKKGDGLTSKSPSQPSVTAPPADYSAEE